MPWAQCCSPSGERMPKRNRPPGRASAFQDSTSKPFGPHQRARCAASVQTLKTRLRGASYSRSRTSTRPAGTPAAAPSAASPLAASLLSVMRLAVMCWLLGLQLAQVVAQAVEALLPEAAVVLDPVGDLLQGAGLQPAGPPLRRPPPGDQAG